MVTITKVEKNIVFEVKGWHKLWALKSKFIIPLENVLNAKINTYHLKPFTSLRLPGTYIPGLITAGTYVTQNGTLFYDVVRKGETIEVDLKNERYKKLIIDVENIDKALILLNTK